MQGRQQRQELILERCQTFDICIAFSIDHVMPMLTMDDQLDAIALALYGFECQEEGRSSEFGQGISEFLEILIEFEVGDVGFVLQLFLIWS